MVFGFVSALIARRKAPRHEDAYFGQMRFLGDHWVGSAPNREGKSIEVMLLGGAAERRDFGRQRGMYEEVLQRYAAVTSDARSLIERLVAENGWGPAGKSEFFRECQLEHVMLPDPEAVEMHWDMTVQGPWPRFLQRSDDRSPGDNRAMFVINLDGWQPIAVDLA